MADAHFEVYNADSSLQIDLGSKSLKLLAIQATSGVDGSYSNSAITGTMGVSTDYIPGSQGAALNISVSAGKVSWTYGAGNKGNANLRMLVP